jgi:hypothetical protein
LSFSFLVGLIANTIAAGKNVLVDTILSLIPQLGKAPKAIQGYQPRPGQACSRHSFFLSAGNHHHCGIVITTTSSRIEWGSKTKNVALKNYSHLGLPASGNVE